MCRYFFNKLIIVFFLLSLVITFGCKKEETDLAAALTLSTQTVELSVGEIQKVTIVTGNGEYVCVSSNKQIVTTTVEKETISIKGEGKGKAEVTVKDKKNRTKKIKISVLEEKAEHRNTLGTMHVQEQRGQPRRLCPPLFVALHFCGHAGSGHGGLFAGNGEAQHMHQHKP